jgi:hypothetical protein
MLARQQLLREMWQKIDRDSGTTGYVCKSWVFLFFWGSVFLFNVAAKLYWEELASRNSMFD